MLCVSLAKFLTCECVVEDIVLLEHPSARVEDAHTSLLSIVDLVSSQHWVRICLDPHTSQCIAVDVILDE